MGGINNHSGVEIDIQGVTPLEGNLGASGDCGNVRRDLNQWVGAAVAGQVT